MKTIFVSFGIVVLAILGGLAAAVIVLNMDASRLGQAFTRNANIYSSLATSSVLSVGPGGAAHAALAAKGNRVEATASNYGPTIVHLCKASSCTAYTGIPMAASTTISFTGDNLYTGPISFWSAATTTKKQVYIEEARY